MNKSVYLAGSMSDLPNMGAGWRSKIQRWLEEHGVNVFNPCNEEGNKGATPNWESLDQRTQEAIIRMDLAQVCEFSDYIICYYTQASQGTTTELGSAFYHNVPVYFVTKKKLNKWNGTVSRTKGNKVFSNFKQLKQFLKRKYGYKRIR